MRAGVRECSSAMVCHVVPMEFSSPRVAERRLRYSKTSATVTHSSARYCGAQPCNTNRHSNIMMSVYRFHAQGRNHVFKVGGSSSLVYGITQGRSQEFDLGV